MDFSMSELENTISNDFVMIQHTSGDQGISEDYLDAISNHIEKISDDLRHISLSIHDKPELQFKEYHAHHVLTEYLDKQDGWSVTPSAYGMDTAFVAVFDSGKNGPVVSFNAEYGLSPAQYLAVYHCSSPVRCTRRHRSRLWTQSDRHCFAWRRSYDCSNAQRDRYRW